MMKKNINTIDAYIRKYPTATQKILTNIRMAIQSAAPKAQEAIRYGMPAFVQYETLVYFAAFEDHLSFFPTASGVSAFKKDLEKFDTSKGTVRFSYDQTIPLSLIKKIVKFRVKEAQLRSKQKTS